MTLDTLDRGFNIHPVALHEFGIKEPHQARCVICERVIQVRSMFFEDGKYYLPNRFIFENSHHRILLICHKECKLQLMEKIRRGEYGKGT